MLKPYNISGVYVEEISTSLPVVYVVETAITALIGRTKKRIKIKISEFLKSTNQMKLI